MAQFRQSLFLFLDEVPSPSYNDLVEAFGPPEQMAQVLLEDVQLPPPISRQKIVGFLFLFFFLFLCIGIGTIYTHNVPEKGTLLTGSIDTPVEINQDRYFIIDDPFTHGDSQWKQPKDKNLYYVEIHNTGKVSANIIIRYSNIRSPHTFQVAPGDVKTFTVHSVCPSKHTVSFSSPDGSLSGTIRVLVSKE